VTSATTTAGIAIGAVTSAATITTTVAASQRGLFRNGGIRLRSFHSLSSVHLQQRKPAIQLLLAIRKFITCLWQPKHELVSPL